MSELLVRPSHNDHRLVAALLAPGGGGVVHLRPAIGRLVLDATVAATQPAFAAAARESGTPVLVDPMTFLLQTELAPTDGWVTRTPFGVAQAIDATAWHEPARLAKLVELCVDFQLVSGASIVVPPYPLVTDDPAWLEAAKLAVRATVRHLDSRGLRMPVLPVLCFQRPRAREGHSWSSRLQGLIDVCKDAGVRSVALAVSGTGSASDGYDGVHRVLAGVRTIVAQDLDVIAWRQGLLGPAAIAAGALGYECGIGLREHCDIRALQDARKPKDNEDSKGFARAAGIYVEVLGRSLARPVAQALAADPQMRPRLLCHDTTCCPDGLSSTLEDPRRHAVLARSRALAALDAMPSPQWRLNAVARDAERGALLAELATRSLRDAGRRDSVPSTALNAVVSVADYLRQEDERVA